MSDHKSEQGLTNTQQTEGANGLQFSLTIEVLPSHFVGAISIKRENGFHFHSLGAAIYGSREWLQTGCKSLS